MDTPPVGYCVGADAYIRPEKGNRWVDVGIDPYKGKARKSSAVSRRAGTLAAHGQSLLMLLGSPPDMIRGHPLRETGSAAYRGGLILPIIHQKEYFGNHEFAAKTCIF